MAHTCPSCRTQFVTIIQSWGNTHEETYPWRAHKLTLYDLLLAEVLLQRTQADRVAPVYAALLRRCPDWDALRRIPVSELAEIITSLGFQHQRANKLKAIAFHVEEYGEPANVEDLLGLPGIGQYMARALAVQLFGASLAPLDINIARVLQRVFAIAATSDIRNNKTLQCTALTLVPNDDPARYFLALLDFGRRICVSVNPHCHICPISMCNSRDANYTA